MARRGGLMARAKKKAEGEQRLENLHKRVAALLEVQALKTFEIPIDQTDPAPSNPNAMTEAQLKGTEESLLLYGPVKAGMVRPYDETDRADMVNFGIVARLTGEWMARLFGWRRPTYKDKQHAAVQQQLGQWFTAQVGQRWEMLDAHHRRTLWLKWIQYGLPDGAHPRLQDYISRRTLPCTIHPMSREVARHLRLVLTYDRGTPQEMTAGLIAHELLRSMPMESLLKGLPWTEQQALSMAQEATFDWQAHTKDLQTQRDERDAARQREAAENFKVTIKGPVAHRDALLEVIDAFANQHPGLIVR
jgi:hypothetical protein